MYITVPAWAVRVPGAPTRGMYLEIINRIPTRAPGRPVWALRSTPYSAQAKICLSSTGLSVYLSGFWGYLINYLPTRTPV